jgi:hypothetical protein
MRIGKFELNEDLVVHNPELAKPVFAKCVIVDCVRRFDTQKFEYMALSDEFDDVPEGAMAPWYDWKIYVSSEEHTAAAVKRDNRAQLMNI